MESRLPKLLAALTFIYLISQIILLLTVGKDLELILLSFGLYVAGAVLTATLSTINFGSGFSFGRVRLESVSDRRAKAPQRERETGEFMKMGISTGAQSPATNVSTPQSALERLEQEIIPKSQSFGGLGAVKEMADRMSDTQLSDFLRKMGYASAVVADVRQLLARLTAPQSQSSEFPVKVEQKPVLRQRERQLHTSLNDETFNEYIRRCMSGNDTPQDMGSVSFKVLPNAVSQAAANEPLALPQLSASTTRRMMGIRTGGGLMKCGNCASYNADAKQCERMVVAVETKHVCDGWQQA